MSAPNRGNRFKKSEDNNLYRVDVDRLHGAIPESKKQPSDTHNGTNMPTQVSPQNQRMQLQMAYHKQLEMAMQTAEKREMKAALAALLATKNNPRASGHTGTGRGSGGSNDSQIKKDAEVAFKTAAADYDETCILACIKDLYDNREFWRLHLSMPQMKVFMADGMNVREAAGEAAREAAGEAVRAAARAAARVASRGGGLWRWWQKVANSFRNLPRW